MVFGVCNPDAEEDMVCGADPGAAVEVSGVEAALLSPPWLSSPAGVTLRFFNLRLLLVLLFASSLCASAMASAGGNRIRGDGFAASSGGFKGAM